MNDKCKTKAELRAEVESLRAHLARLEQIDLGRKRVEETLRQSEAKYRTLVEQIPAVVYTIGIAESTEMHYVSPQIKDLLGYSQQEYVADPDLLRKRLHPDDRERVAAEGVASYATEGPFWIEYRMIRRDGAVVWVRDECRFVRDENGEPLAIQGVISDITERKRTQEELKKSEDSYHSLIDDVIDSPRVGIFILDSDFKVVWMNRPLEEYFGIRREDVVGKDKRQFVRKGIKDIFEAPDGFARRVIATYDDNTYVENFECHVLPEGKREERWLEHWSQPIRSGLYAGGRIEHYYDVTQRRVLEVQLRLSQRMEAVGRLAGGIAHDFNNLLTGIIGYAQLLLGQVEEDSPAGRDLAQVRELADRAATLTRQLLAFSRRQILEPIVLNINTLVENITRMLQRIIGEDIDLQLAVAPDLGNVRADPAQVEQVLMNLAVNARDAMPNGGKLTIETANVVLDQEYANGHIAVTPGPHVMLAVSDTGHGMDEETQQHVFEPFFTTKEAGEGTGLGLATVYGIVKQHGGNIWVYSEPGEGTTFKVYLPRVEEEAEALPSGGPEGNPARGTETILVVEDERMVRDLVKRVLEGRGYTVLTAASPGEAEQVLDCHREEIALLLTDVVLPERSGRELYETLAESRPSLKVLYISGYTGNAISHRGVLEAGTAFLQKPFTPDALAGKVREVLDAG